ncbi:MAG: cobalt-precorrin-4/precorrin-4 C(11)-methyltransferase [Actinomycetota bacterium]
MTVHFVGAGPGAADLLTVRATRLLAAANVVLFPGTYLDPDVLATVTADTELIDTQHLDLDQIIDHLVRAHRAGKKVVRFVSGDPSLYSALTEQARRLDAAGVPWDVTPGVPAYAAAAARIGRELTVPLVTQSVVLTRTQARSTAMPATESLAGFAGTRSTLVLHLAITKIAELMVELEPHYGPDCPVAVVYRASQPDERVVLATIDTAADAVAGMTRAAVIVVGWALALERGGESFLYDAGRDRPGS